MPRTFRLAAGNGRITQVEYTLALQNFATRPLPFYGNGRELLDGPLPLGSSLAARFGYIYIQDASSMLPPLALSRIIEADGALSRPLLLLDMCASPGGKTSLLSRLVGPRALVLGNEPSPKRLTTLRRNLELMNEFGTATISHPGQELPLPSAGGGEFEGFDYILLDPPCSGWGTVDKNPQVLELWQGERLGPLVGLQRLLLREAVRLLKPGGAIVYSTCTTNVQENEEQIAWATSSRLDDELNAELGGALSLLPLEPFAGFIFERALAPLEGAAVLRVAQEGLGQGFFIAALRKGVDVPSLERRGGPPLKKTLRRTPPAPSAHPVDPSLLSSAFCDLSLLPAGEIHEKNGILYFKHATGLARLPEGFNWRGFALGKNMRLDNALHALMPEAGPDALNMDDPAQVMALVSGQSLRLETRQNEVGLYLRGLPLCRLKARGGRVFI